MYVLRLNKLGLRYQGLALTGATSSGLAHCMVLVENGLSPV